MSRNIPIVILLISCCLGGAFAQKSITGTCIDSVNNIIVAHAEIFNLSDNRSVQSDAQGTFEIEVQKYPVVLVFFSMSYATKYDTLYNHTTDFLVYLDPLEIDLESLTIQARRQELFGLKQRSDTRGMTIMAGKKVEIVSLENTIGNLAINNGRQVYAKVAGLNIYEGSDGGLQLNIGGRGLDPNRTSNFNTRQNHYDISADVLGYPESYYVPPPEALEDIEVIRGAASLQYGTQFGGLLNFNLREISSFQKYHFIASQTVGSFGLWNTYLYAGFHVNKLSVNVHFNNKVGEGYRAHSNYDNQLGILSMKYDINKKSYLKLEATYSRYLAQQAGGLTDSQWATSPRQSTRERNWFAVDWRLYQARYQYDLSTDRKFSLSVFGLDARRSALGFRGNPLDLNSNPITVLDEQNSDGSYLLPRDLIIGDFNNIGLESKYIHSFDTGIMRNTLLVGTKLYIARNQSEQGPGSTDDDPDFRFYTDDFPGYPNQSFFLFPNFNASLFAEDIIYIGDKWSLTPGVRLEYINTGIEGSYQAINYDLAGNPINIVELEDRRNLPRFFPLFGLGVSYKSSRKIEYYGNVSQNYRSVTFADIRTVNPTFIIDPDISDERGFTTDAGLRGVIDNYLSYDVNVYNVYYADRIGIVLDDRANRVRKNIGVALITGVESLVEYDYTKHRHPESLWKLRAYVNAAFTNARYLRSEEVNVVGKQVEFVPVSNIKTGISIGRKDLIASIQYAFLSKQFTDVQNSERADPLSSREGILGPIPAYGVMDLTVSYKYRQFRAQLSVNNLLNRSYYTRRATGYPGPGIIPSEGRGFYLGLTYEIIKL